MTYCDGYFVCWEMPGIARQAKPVPRGRRGYRLRDAQELGYDGGRVWGGRPDTRDGYGSHRKV